VGYEEFWSEELDVPVFASLQVEASIANHSDEITARLFGIATGS
jgi:hypothetical protein